MRVALDTNAYCLLMEGAQPVAVCINEAEAVFIPVTVLGELLAGFYSGSRFQMNVDRLSRFLLTPGIQIVPTTREMADRYGRISRDLKAHGRPIPTNDMWIAAAAMEVGAHLLTYDAHVQYVPGLVVVAP